MKRRTKLIGAGALAVSAVVLTGAGVAVASGGGDDEGHQVPITGTELDKATAVALQETGGGRVTETEKGDEEGAYQVEVTLDDGTQVDVNLDSNFHVINAKSDSEGDH